MGAGKRSGPDGDPGRERGSIARANDSARRPRPPYARELAAILDAGPPWRLWGASPDGQHLALTVTAGPEAWTVARDYLDVGAPVLVAPPGEDSSAFDWRLVAGHPPVLLRACGDLPAPEVGRLAAALLRDGAERVLVQPSGRRYVAGGQAHG